jgi:L,D-transpeptidase ErfK/SrfK
METQKISFKDFFLKKISSLRLYIIHSQKIQKNIIVFGLIAIIVSLYATFFHVQKIQNAIIYVKPAINLSDTLKNKNADYTAQLKREISNLERRVNTLIPSTSYLVVNTTENKFKLYRSRELKYEGVCSTGSYIMLEADSTQKWIFKTPRGIYRILGKTESPVWRKPDWAFIEEGLPIPAPYASERYEYGVLGDYALSLGDGYLIHGTLYKRQLGMPVTHGCIRLGDEELEKVYYSLQHGSKVFIF